MLKRGAPAPQCEPLGPSDNSVPGLRMSYPSSVIIMPLTPLILAPADAKLAVGPVFASTRPSLRRSRGSPFRQAGSVYVPEVVPSFVRAAVGQPMPVFHSAATRKVLNGSNSNGTTVN